LLHVFAFVLLLSGLALADSAPGIDDTRAALEKYVEVQRAISQEKRDLALSREVLNERIELVEREIGALREKIGEAEKSIAEGDQKRVELVAENDRLAQTAASLADTLGALEQGVRVMLQRLPEPIRERVRPLSQRLPDGSAGTRLSTAERFQNVVGILNEIDKFNRNITVTSEVRTLPDGTSAEVAALYLGIGQAYYAGANGTVAGIGLATEQGWVWRPANDAAPRIEQTIAIMKNEQVASFVPLPIEIQQTGERHHE
jgi:hypothetical protein